MGMYAEILAIGKFNSDLAEHLEYSDYYYKNTRDGAPIIEHLFGIVEGSSLSREFANLLGVSDPWDFNQHKLDTQKFDKAGLKLFVEIYDDYDYDLDKLNVLIDAEFEFYFLPNG